jgi:tetratricopeptide (TPR) repeat protein
MDIIECAFSAYLTQKYDKGIEMAEFGLQKEPRNSTLNRLAIFCNTEKGNFDKAIDFADRLFNKSDSANISYMDYVYYGNALNGLKRHDEAIAQYKKALEQEFDNADKKAGVVKTLSDAYKGVNDYDNAIKYYQQFLNDVSKASASDHAGLGRLYAQHANALEDKAAKMEKLRLADEVYAGLLTKYQDVEDYVAFQRARIGMQMDPDSKQELAKPHYEKLVELLGSKAERDNTDNVRLIEAYRYLISYYLINKDDKETAKQFAAKLKEVDPENETAKQVLELK